MKRRKDYNWYWKTLKDNGLWDNPTYLDRKQEMGCFIDDVREVMPHCTIKDARDRCPNPPDVPYLGHRRLWKARWPHMDRPHYSFSAQHINVVLQLAYILTHSYFCQWLLQEFFFRWIQSLAWHLKLQYSNFTLIIIQSTDCVTMHYKMLSICHPWTRRFYLRAPCVGQFCLVGDWSDSIVQMWLQ